jgi:3-methyl-2-oxobutanoate hydroxymethyltransferase
MINIGNPRWSGVNTSSGNLNLVAATIAPASCKDVVAPRRAQALSVIGGGALEDIMSLTPIGHPSFSHGDGSGHKVTTAILRELKLRHEPITCLTAYDYSAARLVDEAGIDMVLVGDSLAQTMLGYENTLSVTMDEMLHHVKAVRRGVKRALLLADMPYGSYQVDPNDALRNATRFVKEGGAEVVKIEGGEKRADLIRRIIDAEIPVAGHIGLTPQSVNVMGGYKVQGKDLSGIEQLMRDAVALDRAGVACIVLEGIPREVAAMITAEVGTPTIGIGAGPECDGQVLVINDLLNLTFAPSAKFVRHYGDAGALISQAVRAFADDVKSGQYPVDEESYHLPRETKAGLDSVLERKRAMRR